MCIRLSNDIILFKRLIFRGWGMIFLKVTFRKEKLKKSTQNFAFGCIGQIYKTLRNSKYFSFYFLEVVKVERAVK